MVSPHGGKLINQVLPREKRQEILKKIKDFKNLVLDKEKVKEVKNIGFGVYSPLTGFLKEKDFQSVVSKMRLQNGIIWSVPLVLDITAKEYQGLKNEKRIVLLNTEKKPIALLQNIETYLNDKDFFAQNVYGTKDKNHPGVADVYKMGDYLVGGEIKLLDTQKEIFPEYNFTPEETRKIFHEKGWKNIVAFQTRNVPHLGHEFLQKSVLQNLDGLLVHPVIGEKKLADFKDEFILASYQLLIDEHYPKNKVLLGILPYKMKYAGPREAVLHALIRKNFGCTHFIVGRDHAGVGKYYPPYAAQEIFDQFKKEEIGIKILKCPEVIYCQSCQKHVFINSCSHPEKDKVFFSGTKIRELIQNKEEPPFHVIRPEVYFLLSNSANPLVDYIYKTQKNQKGFVLWFTGLSQSGKSTLASEISKILIKKGIVIERLDGDAVRQTLSKGLGFSREDRDKNIRRAGSIAKLFSKRGVVVIASFISPYRKIREKLKKEIPNFIEIYCKCPVNVCEKRDTKGLYKKARRGEIKCFTGISDPYEEPKNPDILIKSDKESIQESAQKIINFLKERRYLV